MSSVLSIISVLVSVVVLLLFIAFIVGLVKPTLVLFWSKKPTRIKVFGWWIVSIILCSFMYNIVDTQRINLITDEERIDTANIQIKENNYKEALVTLSLVDSSNAQANELKRLVDSLQHEKDLNVIRDKEAQAKEIAELEIKKQKDQLRKEIASIDDGIDFSIYRGSLDALQIELVLFNSWAKTIKSGEASNNTEVKKLSARLKSRIGQLQVKEFPNMRKEYGKLSSQNLWENDITVSTNGTGNSYINFTGSLFAANKNKKDFQNQIVSVLSMYRFKQSRYRWYEEQSKYTYYEISEEKDSDLVLF